ncbi:hypothetical protein GCM10010172_12900 [Paractinoplanes ferrugineus]|uniref:Signal transduction histidine kinase n=1 Tax=Paractinoplanes ferrugineus TaxID=113564 RepID=A0A919MET2_9ACTN|nr:hypothetical protein [Actinoplanes ferrugineus]GIE09855.1 hypothetical protein Afe05nite_16950 [Actinoplanes ferrugineus]
MADPVTRLVRTILPAGVTFLLLMVVAPVAGRAGADRPVALWLPFAVIAGATVLLARSRGTVVRIAARITRRGEVTPYSALAEAARHLRSPSLRDALPGLARALAGGTGARRATIWLVVGDRLTLVASSPAVRAGGPESVAGLDALLSRPGIAYAVPRLNTGGPRAVLAIEKPGSPVTKQDRRLLDDIAHGTALLLRRTTLNNELTEHALRADQLVRESHDFQRRLAQAREVERRRLRTQLSRATAGRLAALRAHLSAARTTLGGHSAGRALRLARTELDELIDRFRVIARGVYPAVLRGQGPAAALEELVADLGRPVRLSGDLDVRAGWAVESAAYQVTAAALEVLATHPAAEEIRVRVVHGEARMRILVEDPAPPVTAEQMRAVLVDDVERLAALGGAIEFADGEAGELCLDAWLPDGLDARTEPTS